MFVFSLDTNLIVAFLSVVRGLEAMENIRVLDARSALCIRYFFLGNPVFGFLRNNYFIVCIGKQVDFQMIVSCSRHLNDTALFSHFNDQVTARLHNSEFSSQRIIGDSNISFSDSFFRDWMLPKPSVLYPMLSLPSAILFPQLPMHSTPGSI